MYGGTMDNNVVWTAVQAFQHLAGISRLRLVVAGAGSRLAACREASRSLAPGRVIFRTPWPVSESDVLLSMADVLILPTVGRQSLVSFPSKLVAYMLSGRPIVALAHSESDLATVIQEAGCGWTADPDRPDLLAEVLRQVSTTGRDELARRGLAGRDYALKHFTRDVCLPRVIDILEEAARVQGAR
jgi:glycosyltransferase involved in cell wall biosynthesis